jgi:hypothetical protein
LHHKQQDRRQQDRSGGSRSPHAPRQQPQQQKQQQGCDTGRSQGSKEAGRQTGSERDRDRVAAGKDGGDGVIDGGRERPSRPYGSSDRR